MTKHHPAHDVELYRDGAIYSVIVSVPDLDPEDLSVRWRDGSLYVSVEPVHVYDDPSSVFHRRIGLPKAIDEESIAASYEDGVLEVELPIVGDRPDSGREIAVR